MKVLMISTDRKALSEGTEVRARFASYGKELTELHVLVLNQGIGEREEKIADNVWVHATNSWLKITALFDAVRIGTSIGKKFGVQVVSTQDPFELGQVGMRIAKNIDAKLHVQVHTDPLSPWFVKSDSKNSVRVSIMGKVLKEADAIRVVSARVKRSLKMKFPDIVEPNVLPIVHGVTTGKVEKGKAPFPFTILCMGRLAPEKHFHKAIDVLKIAQESFPGAGIVFVGDGKEKVTLQAHAVRRGVGDSVRFVGWQEKPASWYGKAHCLLHTGAYEGYGRILVEASLAHLPVVTTDVGIANEVFSMGQDMFICPIDDVKCMSEGIKRLMNDTYLRETMPRNAYDKAAAHIGKYKNYARLIAEDLKRALV